LFPRMTGLAPSNSFDCVELLLKARGKNLCDQRDGLTGYMEYLIDLISAITEQKRWSTGCQIDYSIAPVHSDRVAIT